MVVGIVNLDGESLGAEGAREALNKIVPLCSKDTLTTRRESIPGDAAKAEMMEVCQASTFLMPEIVGVVGIEIMEIDVISSAAIGRDAFGIHQEKLAVKDIRGIPGA